MNRFKHLIAPASALAVAGLIGCFDNTSGGADSDRTAAGGKPKLVLVDLDAYELDASAESLSPAGGAAATKPKEIRWSRDSIFTHQGDTLKWYLSDTSTQMTDSVAKLIIDTAFSRWTPYLPFQVKEATAESLANIVIKFKRTPGFYAKKKKYTYWVKKKGVGVYNVLAGYAFDPLKTSRGLGFDSTGDIYVNDLIHWDSTTGGVAGQSADTLPVDTLNWQDGNGKVAVLGTLNTKTTLVETMTRLIGHALGLGFDKTSGTNLNVMKDGGPGVGTGELADGDVTYITSIYNLPFQLIYGLPTGSAFGDFLATACDSTFRQLAGHALNAKNKALCVDLKKKLKKSRLPSADSTGTFNYSYEWKDVLLALASDTATLNAAGKDDTTWLYRVDSVLVHSDTSLWRGDSAMLASIDTSKATRLTKTQTLLNSMWYDSVFVAKARTKFGLSASASEDSLLRVQLQDSTKKVTLLDVYVKHLNKKAYFSAAGNTPAFIDSVFKHLTGSLPTTAVKNSWKAVLE